VTGPGPRNKATLWSLLIGNFVTGIGVLMPAGLLNELSHAFEQSPAATGTLIAYGAAVLFVEAPLLAFLTNRIERRLLLTMALAVYALGHLASSIAPNFATLLIIRVLMIGGAAVFTPQAASAISLLVPPERRATSVAFIFLGWPMASAVGVPLASLLGAYVGWSAAYVIMGVACTLAAVSVFVTLPSKLQPPTMSAAAWRAVLTSNQILLILAVTMIFIAGQFTVYPYIAAESKTRFDAVPTTISALFAVYGFAGVIGSIVSTSVIGRIGAPRTVTLHLMIVFIGLLLWATSGSLLSMAVAGLFAWGYGGGPAISGQQARLIIARPEAASASVALNTSVLYAGQASGAYIGGLLLSHNDLERSAAPWMGIVAVLLLVAATSVSLSVQRWLRS
jgi:DHA1 family inner membrane transport protein